MVTYYQAFAAAYVRGKLDTPAEWEDERTVAHGLSQGLRLHRFKHSQVLPRVRRVLGYLHALQPPTLLDLGTGRGVFLWPLLEEFPELSVTCVDTLEYRVEDLRTLARGGIQRVSAWQADLRELPFEDGQFPVTTMLEVLEHIPHPEQALDEVCRVTGQALIVSVPSKPDDNPEHLHLFQPAQVVGWLSQRGFTKVKQDAVLNHWLWLAQRP